LKRKRHGSLMPRLGNRLASRRLKPLPEPGLELLKAHYRKPIGGAAALKASI
jgi:hypothetical protein